jgi:hypothetical protein
MNKFSKDLVKSLSEAWDHAEGRTSSACVRVIEARMREIRRKLHLSRQGIRAEISNSQPARKKNH